MGFCYSSGMERFEIEQFIVVYRAMERRRYYQSPEMIQQADVLLEMAFLVESTVDDGLRNGGIFSNYQEQGLSVDDSGLDGWD